MLRITNTFSHFCLDSGTVTYTMFSAVFVVVTSATRCYVCSGAGNSDCGDKYDPNPAHEMECQASGLPEDGGCTKYKSKKENVFGFFTTTGEISICVVLKIPAQSLRQHL